MFWIVSEQMRVTRSIGQVLTFSLADTCTVTHMRDSAGSVCLGFLLLCHGVHVHLSKFTSLHLRVVEDREGLCDGLLVCAPA